MNLPDPAAARLDRLHPAPSQDLNQEEVRRAYAWTAGKVTVRFNFVASVDGAAAVHGLSGPLGHPADRRVFELLRSTADVIVVGAGTVRAEGYAGPLISHESSRWRQDNGLPPHPGLAVVSGSLDLDPDSSLFSRAPVRPVLLTGNTPDPERVRALSRVADVVSAGPDDQMNRREGGPVPAGGSVHPGTAVHPDAAVQRLHTRGYRRILCEGGPRLFDAFQAAGRVDELCLSISPLLAPGPAPRISAGASAGPGAGDGKTVQPLALAGVLRGWDLRGWDPQSGDLRGGDLQGGDLLLLRYVRSPGTPLHAR